MLNIRIPKIQVQQTSEAEISLNRSVDDLIGAAFSKGTVFVKSPNPPIAILKGSNAAQMVTHVKIAARVAPAQDAESFRRKAFDDGSTCGVSFFAQLETTPD